MFPPATHSMKKILSLALFVTAATQAWSQAVEPVRIAIIGLVHDHAMGMIPRFAGRSDALLVGIVEPNAQLVARYAAKFHLPDDLFFPTIDALVAHRKVQAAALFTSTHDHRAAVEKCAELGISVMMEKPMATSLADARAIAEAAKKAGIQVVVNYETSWYPSVQAAYGVLNGQEAIGEARKFVVHDGHEGPKVIGCSKEFLDWLTDPVLNGGGVTMDFGCYGADLVTWMMQGQRPTSVFSVAQHFQPDAYPKVEDEATIILSYPRAQAILEASWNWPYGRKDMQIYGESGALFLPDRGTLLERKGNTQVSTLPVAPLAETESNPVSYLAAVVRGKLKPSGLSSLETNLIVCEILDAAKESARTGRRIDLEASP